MVRENCFWRGSRGLSSRLWRYKGVATQKTPATNRRFQFGTTGLFVGMAVVAVLMASVAFELRHGNARTWKERGTGTALTMIAACPFTSIG